MFTNNGVSKSMLEAVSSVLVEDKKLLLEPEDEKKDRKKKEVEEELKGGQKKIDKNHNGKIDAQDFAILRGKKKGITEMDKSQPSAGRDIEVRTGIDREAKAITAKKAKKDFLGILNKSMAKYHTAKQNTDDKVKGHMKEEYEQVKQLEQGVAEGTKKVQDRKTGKWYDPDKEFEKLQKDPEYIAQMKRMHREQGKGWPKRKEQGVAEEYEQIEELKKSTLASYAKKATDDVSYHSFSAGTLSPKDPERLKDDQKAMKRQAGVSKAVDRLAKEEFEQIEEREMSDAEMKKREEIVKSMKKGFSGFRERYGKRAKDVMYATATKRAMGEEIESVEEDIGAMQSVVGENKGKKAIRVDTLKGITTSNDPEVKIANAHFSGKSATLKAEGKGTDTNVPFVTDSATHKEINKAVKPTFKKIKEMLGKTGTSE